MSWNGLRSGYLRVMLAASLALAPSCASPREAEVRADSTPASSSSSPARAAPPLIAATEPKLESPCSSYPDEGPVGPFRLTETNRIQSPRQIEYHAPDLASLNLEMSGVGVLILEVIISEAGRVEEVQVIRSAHPDFDRISVGALLEARYEPATRHGEPVAVCMVYTVQPHP